MASNRVLAKSINMPFLQSNNKFIYVSLLVVLSFFLLLDYVPGMHAYSAWVTPPLALFLGLAFALLCAVICHYAVGAVKFAALCKNVGVVPLKIIVGILIGHHIDRVCQNRPDRKPGKPTIVFRNISIVQ